MSPRARIASIPVALAAAIGLSVAIGVAPPATADPCTGAAAAAQAPANATAAPAFPSTGGLPTGHRPPGANARAPLPKLGQLLAPVLNAFVPHSARVPQPAAVVPPPHPPRPADRPP